MCSPANRPANRSQYSTKTLIGNWNEELFLLQARTADYLDRLNSGKSILAHNEQLTAYYHAPVQLEAPCLYLKYGANVQLCAVDFPQENGGRKCDNNAPKPPPMMLSLTVPAEHIRHVSGLSSLCDLSVAPMAEAVPCRRNTFKICHSRGASDTGKRVADEDYLRYGDTFHLQLCEPDANGVPLVLYSSPKNCSLLNSSSGGSLAAEYSNRHSEINLTVAVCQRQEPADERSWCLRDIPPLHCNWRVLHRVPSERYETEGEPVPSNERVVICHAASNKCLAAETVWSANYFGREAGVSLENYQTVHRIETFQNRWMFKTAEPRV